jgi:hypothetical protein
MPQPEVSINPVRCLAAHHLSCNVSLEIYKDGCIVLQCDDCDVVIENFGVCRLSEIMPVMPPILEIRVAAEDGHPPDECETPLEVITDFNEKFYEHVACEINEDGDCENDDQEKQKGEETEDGLTIRPNEPTLDPGENPTPRPDTPFNEANRSATEKRKAYAASLGGWRARSRMLSERLLQKRAEAVIGAGSGCNSLSRPTGVGDEPGCAEEPGSVHEEKAPDGFPGDPGQR